MSMGRIAIDLGAAVIRLPAKPCQRDWRRILDLPMTTAFSQTAARVPPLERTAARTSCAILDLKPGTSILLPSVPAWLSR
jgi:hypothetical protein